MSKITNNIHSPKKTVRTALRLSMVALLAVSLSGCTGNDIDDPGSADVVLEVQALENPSVTAALDSATGICTFVIAEWSFNAMNVPKSLAAAESNFNDISLVQVTIEYSWINPTISTPVRTVGLGGVIVPVNGTGLVAFSPIAFDDLSAANQGSTANLTMTFDARTVEGTAIQQTVFRQLNIETCF